MISLSHLRFAVVFLSAAALAARAAPVIPDRAPAPGEIGWRPADGETVRLNPPSFLWPHEKPAKTYTVQWSRTRDFSTADTATGLAWNTYTHRTPLEPGAWYWRYAFADAKGQTSSWSSTRSVIVPLSAVAFPMPDRVEQRKRVPAGHPRLFMRPEDLPRLRELAKGAEADRFRKLRQEADRFIKAGPTPEPTQRGSARNKEDKEAVKYWWPNRGQTERACAEAETIAFVYLMTGDPAYREAARRWVLHLASWDPDGPTNFDLNCEAGKVMLYRPARAYDWAWDALTEEDRAKVRAAMLRRVSDAWKSGEVAHGTGHLTRPYSSHGNRIWHKIGEAGIAFLGEIPEAETWLDYALNKFFACYPVWSDDDGGWHEGVSYLSGYMGKVVYWLQTAKTTLGIDGTVKPFFAQVGDYPLYVCPPHAPNAGFGDLSFRPPSSGLATTLDFFIRTDSGRAPGSRAPCWRWWCDAWGFKADPGGVTGFLLSAGRPPPAPARPPTDLPSSKVFHGIGVASLHTTLLDANDDIHVLFKSSPFGSQSHGHNPQNSFQLNAYGEPLLVACTYRDLHGSKFHYKWVHSTRAQNGVLVNGEGQIPHSVTATGRIVSESLGPDRDRVVGDATATYGGRLTRARRHVAFEKEAGFVALYDELEAKEPSTFQFMLHALKAFAVDTNAASLEIALPKAGATIRYLSPTPLSFRQWDGFDPPPDKEFANQWHVEASTATPAARADVLTVIVPWRAGKKPDVKAERFESGTTVGARVTIGGRETTVTFERGAK